MNENVHLLMHSCARPTRGRCCTLHICIGSIDRQTAYTCNHHIMTCYQMNDRLAMTSRNCYSGLLLDLSPVLTEVEAKPRIPCILSLQTTAGLPFSKFCVTSWSQRLSALWQRSAGRKPSIAEEAITEEEMERIAPKSDHACCGKKQALRIDS